jgi:hypothetical protein
MWLEPAPRPVLEETLFRFLLTVRDDRPRAVAALVADEATLRELASAAAPHPDLCKAFGHCLNSLLIEIDSGMDGMRAPALSFGLALAVNNCIAPVQREQLGAVGGEDALFDEFTAALVSALPTARTTGVALAYHAILRGTAASAAATSRLTPERARLMHALVERSPLTALCSLDVYTPSALETLAAELLPGWKTKHASADYGWSSDDSWLKTVAKLLRDERIARWVRRRWLTMPETRAACRNTGLLLEALRRRGESRAFILDFYESYDYFRARTRADGHKRFWPVLDEIEKLLRVAGDNDAAIQLNRRGNEYFLKFRALVETVIAENGVPTDYAHLSREFIQSLRPLLAFVTEGTRQRLSFGAVAFSDARP